MFFASLCSSVSFGLIAAVSRPWLLLSSNMSVGMLTCLFAAAGTFKGALDPLLFEYGTELAYPRSPATVGGLLTIGGAFQLHIFFFFFFIFKFCSPFFYVCALVFMLIFFFSCTCSCTCTQHVYVISFFLLLASFACFFRSALVDGCWVRCSFENVRSCGSNGNGVVDVGVWWYGVVCERRNEKDSCRYGGDGEGMVARGLERVEG